MSYPEWPLSLPHAQQAGDGNGPMFRDPIETDMDGGDIRRRRRPGDDLIRQRLAFRFTATEAQTWADFVRTTLGNGTARFIMPVSVDGGACELRVVQIIGVPNYDGRSGSLRMYSFEVWVFPADMVPVPTIHVFDTLIMGEAITGATVDVEINGVVRSAVAAGGVFVIDGADLAVGSYTVRTRYSGANYGLPVTRSISAAFVAPFEALSASLYDIHSDFRVLTSWLSPVLLARRSTDGATKNFYAISSAPWLVDPLGVSVAAWAGAGSAYIQSRYGQKGASRNATQATGAAQPRIVNAGVLDVGPNGRPAAVYSGAQYLDIENSVAFNRNLAAATFAAVSRTTAGSSQAVLANSFTSTSAGTRAVLFHGSATATGLQVRNTDAGALTSLSGATVTSGAWTRLIGRARYAAGGVDLAVNGSVSTGSITPAQNTPDLNSAANVRIGAVTSTALFLTGGESTSVLAQSSIDIAALDAALAQVMP